MIQIKIQRFLSYILIFSALSISSCEDFLYPDPDLYLDEGSLLVDYYEYRALDIGLYALQQDVV